MDNTLAMTLQPQSLAPTAEDVAMLTRQYQKALDGLYEAYRFGMMLRAVKERLEAAEDAADDSRFAIHDSPTPEPLQIEGSSRDAARGTAGKSFDDMHGWNRGMGLKGWLAQWCPEINYSTARRFLAVAEKTVAALALADEAAAGDGSRLSVDASPDAPQGASNDSRFTIHDSPDPDKVRAFLAGRSQRSILRLGGKREGAGRKAKDWAAALEASPEIAWKELAEPLERLSRLIVRERRHAVLTAQDLHTLRDAIDLLHEVIHADA